jgi:hypothetical protein
MDTIIRTTYAAHPQHRKELLPPDMGPTFGPAFSILLVGFGAWMTQYGTFGAVVASLIGLFAFWNVIRSIQGIRARRGATYRNVLEDHFLKVNQRWEAHFKRQGDENILRQAEGEIRHAREQIEAWEKRRQALTYRFGIDPLRMVPDGVDPTMINWDDESFIVKASRIRQADHRLATQNR